MVTTVKFDEFLTLLVVNASKIRVMDIGDADFQHPRPCSITLIDNTGFACAISQSDQVNLIRFINKMSGAPDWEDATKLRLKTGASNFVTKKLPQTKLVVNNVEVSSNVCLKKDDVALHLRQESANDKAPDAAYRDLIGHAKMFDVVNTTGKNSKRTALHWAAEKLNSEKIKLLLEAGAKKDALDKDLKTPFDLATAANATKELLSLLEFNNGPEQNPEAAIQKVVAMKP